MNIKGVWGLFFKSITTHVRLASIGFLKTHICSGNCKFKFFSKVLRIPLDRSRVVYGLYEDYLKLDAFFYFE